MKKYTVLWLILPFVLAGCNTLGGFGQDLSETGRAIGEAAGWTQEQLNDANSAAAEESAADSDVE